jgi:hypothetical protein
MPFTLEVRAGGVLQLGLTAMLSTLLLFSDATPDQMVAGAALAVICGIVLLGGRSVIGVPLQFIRSLRSRAPRQPKHHAPRDA